MSMSAVCRCRACGQKFGINNRLIDEPLGEACTTTPKHLGPFDAIPQAVGSGVIDSPRRNDAVYILCVGGPANSVGTAFAVTCRSRRLAVTSAHCVVQKDNETGKYETTSVQLYLTRKLRQLDNGDIDTDGRALFPVRIIKHDVDCDLAVLELTDPNLTFHDTIDLCPTAEMPTPEQEHQVKLYHAPLQLFPEEVQAISPEASNLVKLAQEDGNRYWVQLDSLPGSSGGPLVDTQGRVVGVLRTGFQPELPLTVQTPRVFEEIVEERDGDLNRRLVDHDDEYSLWSGHASTRLSAHYTQFVKVTARGFSDYINSYV